MIILNCNFTQQAGFLKGGSEYRCGFPKQRSLEAVECLIFIELPITLLFKEFLHPVSTYIWKGVWQLQLHTVHMRFYSVA